MARILLGAGVLETIPYYHPAWLFEPLIFLLCWTPVTTMKIAITSSPAGCQAGRGSIMNPCWQKLFALNGLAPDHSAICPATLSPCRLAAERRLACFLAARKGNCKRRGVCPSCARLRMA